MTDPDFHYQARRPGPAVDPALRRIALVAGGIVVVVVGVALVWGSGRVAVSFEGPPVILAPSVPLRVVPADPGGLVVPEADEPIMSGQGSSAPAQLAPAAPVPDVAGFEQAAGVNLMTVPVPSATPAQPPILAPPPAAAAGPKVAAAVAAPPKPAVAAAAAVPVKPKRLVAELPAAASEAAAQAEWARVQASVPGLAGGKSVQFVPVAGSGGTVWRPLVSGFGDIGSARVFCAVLASQGQSCAAGSF